MGKVIRVCLKDEARADLTITITIRHSSLKYATGKPFISASASIGAKPSR